jgi:hypothetical protein
VLVKNMLAVLEFIENLDQADLTAGGTGVARILLWQIMNPLDAIVSARVGLKKTSTRARCL